MLYLVWKVCFVKITELKNFYNFEEQKEARRASFLTSLDMYTHLLQEKDFSNNIAEKKLFEDFVEGFGQILESDELLEKATMLDIIAEIKNVLSSYCHRVDTGSIKEPKTPVFMFGQEIEFDSTMESLSAEELRQILFDAVGFECVPLLSVYQSADRYRALQRKKNQEGYGSVGYSVLYEARKGLEMLTHRSLVSCRQNYDLNDEVDALFYDCPIGIGFHERLYSPKAIIAYPDMYLPERMDREKSRG